MGRGSYQASDWVKLKESRGISHTSNVSQIFKNTELDEKYDPQYINVRESCDSEDSPASTPIIIGFDVTGSMGYLAEELAKNAVNRTVTEIYEKQPVSNPHVMCAAFGNYGDRAPLQVTQFEADIRIAEQLLDLWIERCGRGHSGDTYVWYFAANHTKIECFEKRQKKGFLFTIGDDVCDRLLTPEIIDSIFRDKVNRTYSPKEVLKMATEKYEVFHIITKPLYSGCFEEWNKLLPGRVALIEEKGVAYLAEVIISLMQLVSKVSKEAIISQWSGGAAIAVEKALETIELQDGTNFWGKFFRS